MATKEEILESIAAMSVMEVSELIKMMEEKFGVVAAAAAVAGGYVDEWLDSFDSYDDYEEASQAIDEVNTEWYNDAHLDDLPTEYK